MTVDGNINNTYEEARKLRLEENKKRFEDLGITKISKSLTELTNSEKKAQKKYIPKPKSNSSFEAEPRRSTRTRNPIKSYCDEVDIDLSFRRKRSRLNSSWTSYLARPLEEVKLASYQKRASAFKAAEKLQTNLKSENPSFVKSMVRSHVYSCFWLGLPSKFCEDHLPKSTVEMELEDEDGNECNAMYLGKRSGLSGGWRGFALDHKLDDGDALVFELVQPTRFKIYIVRTSTVLSQEGITGAKKKSKATEKLGFKPKKKITAGKTNGSASLRKQDTEASENNGLAKDEHESEKGNEEPNGIACVELGSKCTRRSKRLATKSP